MARLLLGVSGSVAAYKALEVVRLASAAGHAVRVIETEAAQRFVGGPSFSALSGAPTLVSSWERDPARGAFPGDPVPTHDPPSHLELAARADCMLIAPASANTLAKLAAGLADSLLTETALATRAPLLLAPAMNNHMYEHPATTANLELLRERGATVIEPEEGRLGSPGEWGVGRLADPAVLLAAVEHALAAAEPALATRAPAQPTGDGHAPGGPTGPGAPNAPGPPSPLAGLRVLVTAGGTREPIDAVRYIGNRSSGRMGFAVAEEAAARGADVHVIAANVALERAASIVYEDVETAAELAGSCHARFDDCDVLVMCAAVADFRPATVTAGKLKKSDPTALTLPLERTEDILRTLAERRRPAQTLVGFAAEAGEQALDYGHEKLADKRLDLIVVNDVAADGVGFDADANEVWILGADAQTHVEHAPKRVVAAAVIDAVEALRTPIGALR